MRDHFLPINVRCPVPFFCASKCTSNLLGLRLDQKGSTSFASDFGVTWTWRSLLDMSSLNSYMLWHVVIYGEVAISTSRARPFPRRDPGKWRSYMGSIIEIMLSVKSFWRSKCLKVWNWLPLESVENQLLSLAAYCCNPSLPFRDLAVNDKYISHMNFHPQFMNTVFGPTCIYTHPIYRNSGWPCGVACGFDSKYVPMKERLVAYSKEDQMSSEAVWSFWLPRWLIVVGAGNSQKLSFLVSTDYRIEASAWTRASSSTSTAGLVVLGYCGGCKAVPKQLPRHWSPCFAAHWAWADGSWTELSWSSRTPGLHDLPYIQGDLCKSCAKGSGTSLTGFGWRWIHHLEMTPNNSEPREVLGIARGCCRGGGAIQKIQNGTTRTSQWPSSHPPGRIKIVAGFGRPEKQLTAPWWISAMWLQQNCCPTFPTTKKKRSQAKPTGS